MSSDCLHVLIPGPPVAQGRGRAFAYTPKGGGKPRASVFDPKNSRDWKATAQQHMTVALMEVAELLPDEDVYASLEGPLEVHLLFVFEMPKSRHRKTMPRPREWYVGQKDIDNMAKAVLDAGNGVLWIDDRQVARIHAEAIVGRQGEMPRVELIVRPLLDVRAGTMFEAVRDGLALPVREMVSG